MQKLGLALISCSLNLYLWSEFRIEEQVQTQIIVQNEPIGSTEHFQSPWEKKFIQKRFHHFLMIFFLVKPMAEQNSLFFRDCPLLVVTNVKLVRIQTTGVVTLLIVDVHLNFGKKREQNTVYKNNETIRSLLLLFRFLICFYIFLLLFFLLLRY